MALSNEMGRVQPSVPRGRLHRPTRNRMMGEDISEATVHDGRAPDGSCRRQKVEHLRIGTWNVGSMSGRSGEIAETLYRRKIAICCVQETRLKGRSAKWLGSHQARYKFMWCGGSEGFGGVGVLVREDLLGFVSKVVRINERLITLTMRIEGRCVNFISAYAPQVGRNAEEKEEFWLNLHEIIRGIKPEESVVIGGDLNGHVGRHSDGYETVHGGMGFGSRNREGETILDTCDVFDLAVCNTYFRKKDSHLVTYDSGGHASQIDYFLVRKCDRRLVTNAKVIPNEECVQQHRLLVADMHLLLKRKLKRKFVPKLKIWKFRSVGVRNEYAERIRLRSSEYPTNGTVQDKWMAMKKILSEEAEDICGRTKGPPRVRDTWWWNDIVDEAIRRKRDSFAAWRRTSLEADRERYRKARRAARKAVWEAQQTRLNELTEELEVNQFDQSIFKVAKRMCRENEDGVAPTVLKDDNGVVFSDDTAICELWRTYMSHLLNTENAWSVDNVSASPIIGPTCQLSKAEVVEAVAKSRKGKAPGTSEIVIEMVEASGNAGIDWLLDLFNSILRDRVIPSDWQMSVVVPVYKGKGDVMSCGSYRAIKLLDQTMKIFERALEKRIREKVEINDMQFGFMPGKGTTDAIFLVRQLQERFGEKKKNLHMAFIDLEKAFDRVPRQVVQWALRVAGIDEWLVDVVMLLFKNSKSVVKWGARSSDCFDLSVGVHQGSVLSPLLFAVTLDGISKNVREGLPWEVLYADDLVLIAEEEDQLIRKISTWKRTLAEKGLKVNIEKSKVMKCTHNTERRPVLPAKYPCTICQRNVGANSIICSSCNKWTHKRCSEVTGSLASVINYACRRCNGSFSHTSTQTESEFHLVDGERLQSVDRFCYLGDTLDSGGGSASAVQARIRCAWGKFRELSPFLTSKAPNLKMKARIYESCVRNTMLYGSETWGLTKEELKRLETNEMMMARWMCGVSLHDRIPNDVILRKLGLEELSSIIRRRRLRWFGHVVRMDNNCWTKRVQFLDVAGRRPAGRPRKSWKSNVDEDLRQLGLVPHDALDRDAWRAAIRRNRRTQSNWNKRR